MEPKSVVIAGAGMGGLTAAITAAECGRGVTLLEKGDKVGGAMAFGWLAARHVAAAVEH